MVVSSSKIYSHFTLHLSNTLFYWMTITSLFYQRSELCESFLERTLCIEILIYLLNKTYVELYMFKNFHF